MIDSFNKQYFKKQISVLGEMRQKDLAQKSVALIGAGGLGGFYAYALSGFGLKKLYVVDFDEISLSNIHRQIVFDFDDIGKNKAGVYTKLQNRTKTQIVPIKTNADDFFKNYSDFDLILDATDNVNARITINAYAKKLLIPFVYTSVDGFCARACIYKNKDFIPTKNLPPKGQIPPMVMLSASIGAVLGARYLAGLDVECDRLYHVDFSDTLNVFKFDI